jgi:rhodanese-related sulfurtransferase
MDVIPTQNFSRAKVMIDAITVEEFQVMRSEEKEHFLLDVREPFEFDIANIGGKLIPMNTIPAHIDGLPHDKPIVVLCHTGRRSHRVMEFLRHSGFTNVLNLTGGIAAWSDRIDPTIAKY